MTSTLLSADLRLAGVSKTYTAAGGNHVQALAPVDLTIPAGQFVCLLGASGCGKSTLLRLIAGFESPSTGSLTVGGEPVRGPGPDRGVVFQDYGLFPWLTVAENVGYGPKRRGMSKEEVAERTSRFLELVQLQAFAKRYPQQLSGGMQQRVGIARVLANDPGVLLMDEPFAALDSLTRERLQRSLVEIWTQVRATVVFVTHSVEEAVYLADRVVVMSGGPNHGVPGHVALDETLDLDRPRDVTDPEFNAVKRRLLDVIHRGAGGGEQ